MDTRTRNDDEARREAVERIRARRGLTLHATMYVLVNVALVLLWLATGADAYWPVWVHLGWGIGVAAHAAAVLTGDRPITEEQIERELTRR